MRCQSGAELAERHLVTDDVVVGDEEVMADRADGDGLAATSAQLGEVGGQVGVLVRTAALAHSVSASVSQRGPGRVWPERRRPADS